MNSKLHAVCDGLGRPIMLLLTEGQISDQKGVFLLFSALPRAKKLLAAKAQMNEAAEALQKSADYCSLNPIVTPYVAGGPA